MSWMLVVLIPLSIVWIFTTYIAQPLIVSGDSMYPEIKDGDMIVMKKTNGNVPLGSVVVISVKYNEFFDSTYIVKRVIASAGQQILIDYEKNTISVDGDIISEPYLNCNEVDPLSAFSGDPCRAEYFVPAGQYFALGDNRNHSTDSRDEHLGMIPKCDIVGTVILTIHGGWIFG